MSGEIPDGLVQLDSQSQAPSPSAQSAASSVNSPEIPDSAVELDSDRDEKYGTPGQQAIAGIEGVTKGFAGPLATGAERFVGVPAEDIAGREEANPWTHGIGQAAGIGGSLLTGYGEAALIGKAGAAAAEAANLGKIGSIALKGAIEGGLFQGGDEISKSILGQSDPEAPVSSALVHMGASGLLGGAFGVGLSSIGKAGGKLNDIVQAKTGTNAAQFLADLGNRFDFLHKSGNIPQSASEEASNLWNAVSESSVNGYSLKKEAVQKLTEDLNPEAIVSHIKDVSDFIASAPKALKNEELFKSAIGEWQDGIKSGMPSDVFEATDNLKRQLQEWGQYNKKVAPLAEQPFRNAAKSLGFNLRNSLEDTDVWGEMGDFQKNLNKAFSDLQPYQKDFLQSVSGKKLGENEIDPGKMSSLLKQVTKGGGDLTFRGTKVADFIPRAKDFIKTVNYLHSSMGVESSISPVSTNVLDEMLSGKSSPGSKVADWIFGGGPKVMGLIGGRAIGTVAGAAAGSPYLGYRAGENIAPLIEEGLGRKLTRWGVSGALRALSAGDHSGVPQAINYAERIGKGSEAINKSLDNLFTIGGQKYLNHEFSEKQREDLRNHVANGSLNQQIQNQSTQPVSQGEEQKFAHGGEVLAPESTQPISKPVPPVIEGKDSIAQIFPEQSMLLGAAKGRINNYLNNIRPQSIKPKMPFDEETQDKEHDRSYNKALNIANKPLSIIDHIKNGTLDTEHLKHMVGLYPELTNHLKQKMNDKIVDAQMKNEKPPYKVRQSMSLFMGAPLDSTMTQPNIMAAQMVFAKQKMNNPPTQNGKKGGTSKMGDIPNQYRTSDQAAQARQNRIK